MPGTAWRDDRAFAAIVSPLADDLRWRLRVRRRALVWAPHPRLRFASATLVALAMAVAAVSILILTFADAYGTPMVSLRLFG